ncbi:MAG: single-stranded DNA-binding protein [Planctomycetes bacterium]|jgi:single-strand DNA-binding protein|nr:single-stranded DNA-binding protein [Planctomycetota bacterium]MBT4028493.1 single-stranded DNA-binding protein [Planctomycetota bacterium]MBT4559385.1 single-stranded DNA-binding protein [Planctomycetota bacterium]MBT5102274.1 single-stranded DNA-binding protein [Planctomycetota bacterium]MBT7319088.1 single-stranded DNA-binding protein [Planctomycetota bacterium]
MASFNRVILLGNLTRDPESRQAQSGTHIVKASIAVNDRVPDGNGGWREEPSFIDLVIFGRRGENFAKYLGRGRSVLVEGKLRQSRWEDKETGKKRSKLEVIVDDWQFAGGREGGNQGGGQGGDQSFSQGGGGGQSSQQGGGQDYGQSAPSFPDRQDFGGQSSGGGAAAMDDVPF